MCLLPVLFSLYSVVIIYITPSKKLKQRLPCIVLHSTFRNFLNDLFNDGWAVWPAMIRLYWKTANLLLFKMCHRIFLKIYLFSVLRICFISYFVM